MKTKITLRHIQEMPEELRGQAGVLTRMYEEILAAEEKIKYMSYMEETERNLAQAKESLDENIRDLTQMAQVLENVLTLYRQTERQITDHYMLDALEYLESSFGESGIGNLEQYKSLMPF